MIAVLDACVLYPTVLRQILLGCAAQGLFTPIWSERLLEEWTRAAARNGGAEGAAVARAEASEADRRFPDARIVPGNTSALWLPDPADIHVLATAIAARGDMIITQNLKDFPTRELATYGIVARAPDAMLMDLWLAAPEMVELTVARTHAEAERLSGQTLPLRALLIPTAFSADSHVTLHGRGKMIHSRRYDGGLYGGCDHRERQDSAGRSRCLCEVQGFESGATHVGDCDGSGRL